MITIAAHENGPIGMGHGGVSAGRFASLVASEGATVRLHAPIPLETPMFATPDPSGGIEVNALHDEAGIVQIATVRPLPSDLVVGQFGRLHADDVRDAELRWLDGRQGQHMAPTCFACGHERLDGCGLGLRPGPVFETSLFATTWAPNLAGELSAESIWTALDCPSGFPALAHVGPDQAAVTGELSMQVLAPVRGDGNYQLISRITATSGRKVETEAALIDENGRSLAVATATWIAVPIESVRPRRVRELVAA